MSTVLDRVANRPVYIPPEVLVKSPSSRQQDADVTVCHPLRRGGSTRYVRAHGDSVSSLDDICEGPDRSSHPSASEAGVLRLLCPRGDRGLQQSTVVLIVVWFTLSYGTYGVSTWNNTLFANVGLSNPYLCSFIFCVASLPGNVASILLVERVRDCHSRT